MSKSEEHNEYVQFLISRGYSPESARADLVWLEQMPPGMGRQIIRDVEIIDNHFKERGNQ